MINPLLSTVILSGVRRADGVEEPRRFIIDHRRLFDGVLRLRSLTLTPLRITAKGKRRILQEPPSGARMRLNDYSP
jgi:hypothetical protein